MDNLGIFNNKISLDDNCDSENGVLGVSTVGQVSSPCACNISDICFTCSKRVCGCSASECECPIKCSDCKFRSVQFNCDTCTKAICIKCTRHGINIPRKPLLERYGYCVDCFSKRKVVTNKHELCACGDFASGECCTCGAWMCIKCKLENNYCTAKCEPKSHHTCDVFDICFNCSKHTCECFVDKCKCSKKCAICKSAAKFSRCNECHNYVCNYCSVRVDAGMYTYNIVCVNCAPETELDQDPYHKCINMKCEFTFYDHRCPSCYCIQNDPKKYIEKYGFSIVNNTEDSDDDVIVFTPNFCKCLDFEVCCSCKKYICNCKLKYLNRCECKTKCHFCHKQAQKKTCGTCGTPVCSLCIVHGGCRYCYFPNETRLSENKQCNRCSAPATYNCSCNKPLCQSCKKNYMYCNYLCNPHRSCPNQYGEFSFDDHRCSYCFTSIKRVKLLLLCFKAYSVKLVIPKIMIRNIIGLITLLPLKTPILNYSAPIIISFSRTQQAFYGDSNSSSETSDYSDETNDSSDETSDSSDD